MQSNVSQHSEDSGSSRVRVFGVMRTGPLHTLRSARRRGAYRVTAVGHFPRPALSAQAQSASSLYARSLCTAQAQSASSLYVRSLSTASSQRAGAMRIEALRSVTVGARLRRIEFRSRVTTRVASFSSWPALPVALATEVASSPA